MLLRRQRIDQPQGTFDLAVELREYATSYLVGSANGFTGDGRPITFAGGLVANETWQGKAYRGDTTDNIAYATPSRNFIFGTDKDFTFVFVARKRSAGVDGNTIAGFGSTGGSSGNTLFRLIGGGSANAVKLQAQDSGGSIFLNTDTSDFGWDDLNYHGIVIKGRVANSSTDNGANYNFADGKTAGSTGGLAAANPAATTFNVVSACAVRRGGSSVGFGSYDVALFLPLIGIQMPDDWCLRASSLDTVWQTCFEPRRIWVPVDAPAGGSGPVGTATETDAALALSGLQILGAGLATETDTAQALGGVSITATGLSTETDDALALTPLQLTATGRADETDTALALTSGIQGPVGVAVETDEALALAAVQIAATGRADETDTALALNPGTSAPVGTATESDTAFALAAVQQLLVGVAAESDAALALTSPNAALRGRVRRRTRTPLPPEDTTVPTPPEPAPAIRTLVQGANELIVTKGREVITLQRIAEAKRRALARKAEEEAIERALMEWF